MTGQEVTSCSAGYPRDTEHCENIGWMLSRITDKWTLLIVRLLRGGPYRFNALRREIGDISQKVLASTLRELETNGLVSRTVVPIKPIQVEYALTPLGHDFSQPVRIFAEWVIENQDRLKAARAAYAQNS